MDVAKPFPFLSLPKKLGLMVYERIPVQIKERILENCDYRSAAAKRMGYACTGCSYTIFEQFTTVSVLLTCRQISAEASSIICAKLAEILSFRPRIITDPSLLATKQSMPPVAGTLSTL